MNCTACKIIHCLFFMLFAAGLSIATAQNNSYFDPEQRVQTDQVYKDYIRTVQFYNSSVINSYPIIQFGTDRVTLGFDEINSKTKDYQFTVVHCDANWQPSQLLKSEYLDGLFTDYIQGYSMSSGTYKSYIHYKLDFPTANTRLKMSGNYILKVYTDNEKNPVLTRRFYVFENGASVSAEITRASYTRYSDTKQQVNFSINTGELSLTDPFNNIKVVVRQNWRNDNEIRNLKPKLIQNKILVYNYDEENLFDGGSEFRAFDISDVRYTGTGIRYFTFDSLYHATLFGDEDRSPNIYTKYVDQDGNYSIFTKQGTTPYTEADYVWVYFRLKATTEPNQDVYIYGGLTNWLIDRRFKMTYIPRDGEYQGLFLLKQGYYDYEYATVSDKGEINTATLEGSHWETENNYTILVYFRPTGQNYDLLVGKGSFNSQIH
jgi:hypothetical protein